MTREDRPEHLDVRDWPNVTIEHEAPGDDTLVVQPLRVFPPTQRQLAADAAAQGIPVSVLARKIIEAHYAQASGDVVTIKRDVLLTGLEQAVNRATVAPPADAQAA